MAHFDEDRPTRKIEHEIGQDLSLLSIDDIDKRIDLLREEIGRLEADKEKKKVGRAAADSFFRR